MISLVLCPGLVETRSVGMGVLGFSFNKPRVPGLEHGDYLVWTGFGSSLATGSSWQRSQCKHTTSNDQYVNNAFHDNLL
jgi:hypothetical protein